MHDLIDPRVETSVDDIMDQVLHHSGVNPDGLTLRRLFSYYDNLQRLLEADANVYGWGTE